MCDQEPRDQGSVGIWKNADVCQIPARYRQCLYLAHFVLALASNRSRSLHFPTQVAAKNKQMFEYLRLDPRPANPTTQPQISARYLQDTCEIKVGPQGLRGTSLPRKTLQLRHVRSKAGHTVQLMDLVDHLIFVLHLVGETVGPLRNTDVCQASGRRLQCTTSNQISARRLLDTW